MKTKLIIALLIGLLIGSILGGVLVPVITATGDYDYQIYNLLKKIQKDVDDIEYNTYRIMMNQ